MVSRFSELLANINSLPRIGTVGVVLVNLEVWSMGVAINMSGCSSLLLLKDEVISEMSSSNNRMNEYSVKCI